MSLTVYGIPTCDTVRKAQSWLDRRALTYTRVDLRAAPPSRDQIARWVAAVGAGALANTSGGSYRALGPGKEGWTDAEWIAAYAADPMLIRRPVIERDGALLMVGFRGSDEQIAARLGI